jgi:hypothetical protein
VLKEEFEERVGLKVTLKEYAEIEKTYAEGTEVDKDVFCQEWLTKLTGAEYKAMAERVIVEALPPLTKGTLTTKRVMEAVFNLAKKMPEYKRAASIIDYTLAEYEGAEITKYEFNFVAATNPNCSEGIYIDCWLEGAFDNYSRRFIKMGTVKTLERSQEAMMIMGELTGLLTVLAGKYIDEQICRGYFEQ